MEKRMLVALALVAVGVLAGCGGDDDGAACEGPNGPCLVVAPGDGATEIQEALIAAQPGDVVFFRAGVYELTRALSLDVDRVTLRGEGMDETVLRFAGQVDGAQGLLVTADDFTVEDLAVEDTALDGIKVEGAAGVTMRRVRVEWTGEPGADNGAYGLYPVQCEDVLIEDSVVRGASDAGIYVGQSQNIIVRRNLAERNVAGIEIENSSDADVYGNRATANTGGVLVFNLPGLQVQNGARTRVFDNEIVANNWPNFAPPGNIVAKVPQGTGFATIAGHQIEIFDNTFEDNQTVNAGVISFLVTQIEYDDPGYDPYSDTIHVHDNVFVGGGDRPSDELGFLLIAALGDVVGQPVVIPDLIFDGISDPAKSDELGQLLPEFAICMQGNGDADFGYLDAANDFEGAHVDASLHDCAHEPLPAVTIEGVGE